MFKIKLAASFDNCQGLRSGKSVFSLICVGKLLPWQNCPNKIFVKIKKLYIKNLVGFLPKAKQSYKIRRSTFQWIRYVSIVYFSEKTFGRSMLTHVEQKWLCRISSFYEKKKD